MPRRNQFVLFVSLLFFITFHGEAKIQSVIPSDGRAASVVSLSGKILVRNEVQNRNNRALKIGDPVFAGDVINTASNAQMKLLFTDKTIVDLGPTTLFNVDQYQLKTGSDRDVGLSMPYGKLRVAVNQKVGPQGKFRFMSKGATMGVRGTEFLVDGGSPLEGAGASNTQASPSAAITVVEGNVQVQSGNNTTAVTTGQKLDLSPTSSGSGDSRSPASAPQVSTLSAGELQTAKNAATIPDQTFQAAVVVSESGTGHSTLATVGEGLQGALGARLAESMVESLMTQLTQQFEQRHENPTNFRPRITVHVSY